MLTPYQKQDRTFAGVSAYAILLNGSHVANLTAKHATACTAYVHWIGKPMETAQAKGGGYDRQSAAFSYAAAKMPHCADSDPACHDFRQALVNGDDGSGWVRNLEQAGFRVCTVI